VVKRHYLIRGDEIPMPEASRVIERGGHGDLLAPDSKCAAMWRASRRSPPETPACSRSSNAHRPPIAGEGRGAEGGQATAFRGHRVVGMFNAPGANPLLRRALQR